MICRAVERVSCGKARIRIYSFHPGFGGPAQGPFFSVLELCFPDAGRHGKLRPTRDEARQIAANIAKLPSFRESVVLQ